MKNNWIIILTLIFCGISMSLVAQTSDVQIRQIDFNHKICHGTIDDHYPITIYLKFHQYSDMSSAVYSVKGWYYYDKYKTQIPVVGLVTGLGMNLYVFDSKEKADTILNFKSDKSRFWDAIDYFQSMKGFTEKFTVMQSDVSDDWNCCWKRGSKTMDLELFDMQFDIKRTMELLEFSDGSTFNLQNLGAWKWNFKLLAADTNQNNILLSFDYPSRGYYGGMCGGGREQGFVGLQFSSKKELINFETVKIWSCNEGIDLESKSTKSSEVEIFSTFSHDQQKNIKFILDYNKAIIRKD